MVLQQYFCFSRKGARKMENNNIIESLCYSTDHKILNCISFKLGNCTSESILILFLKNLKRMLHKLYSKILLKIFSFKKHTYFI